MGRARGRWLVAMVLGAGWLLVAAKAGALDPAGEQQGRTLYQSYCAGCHGDLHEVGGPWDATGKRAAPDLRELGAAHGSPIPRAALLYFVLDPRRTGVARICSERPFAWAAPGMGSWAMRRGAVLDVLRYLETLQRTPEPERRNALGG